MNSQEVRIIESQIIEQCFSCLKLWVAHGKKYVFKLIEVYSFRIIRIYFYVGSTGEVTSSLANLFVGINKIVVDANSSPPLV